MRDEGPPASSWRSQWFLGLEQRFVPVTVGGDRSGYVFRLQGERRPRLDQGGKADRPCQEGSDIDLLRYGKGVVDLNAEVANRALDLGMADLVWPSSHAP